LIEQDVRLQESVKENKLLHSQLVSLYDDNSKLSGEIRVKDQQTQEKTIRIKELEYQIEQLTASRNHLSQELAIHVEKVQACLSIIDQKTDEIIAIRKSITWNIGKILLAPFVFLFRYTIQPFLPQRG